MSRSYVDYDVEAARYRAGRALAPNVLDRWAAAVRPHIAGAGRLRVVDVGAGTGIFAAAWPEWVDAHVVAIEPSAGMMAAAARSPLATWSRGCAEALPLASASADVVWLSTSLHHFADTALGVAEVTRVLSDRGVVLVRTYVPGVTEISWVDALPGRDRWSRRFHTLDDLRSLFAPHGLEIVSVQDVVEGREPMGASASWVDAMRSTDSILTALSDAEIDEAIERLRENSERVGTLALTLVVLTRGSAAAAKLGSD